MAEKVDIVPAAVDPAKEETVVVEPTVTKPAGGSAFYKTKIDEMAKQNADLVAQLEAQQTTQLQEKENYKELWELEKGKRVTAEEKSVKLSRDYLSGLKMSAIEQEAMKAGIIPAALNDIRIDEATMVEIESGDKGTVSILGAKEYVEHLKETKGHWFGNVIPPIINTATGELPAAPTEMSAKDLIALQKTDPNAYAEEMAKRFKR